MQNDKIIDSDAFAEQLKDVSKLVEQISDPEVPVLSIADLGILRDIRQLPGAQNFYPEVIITPTYSGCPAMDTISMNIRFALITHGYKDFKITEQLSPAWTTDWMTEAGKEKLKAYGIAPPAGRVINVETMESMAIHCPQCNSANTRLLSEFGSTSCKALFQCNDCKEPFDYFKCH